MHIKSFLGGIGVAGVAASLLFVAQCGQASRVPTAPTSCNCSGAQTTARASEPVAPPALVAVHVAPRTPHATRGRAVRVAVHVTASAPVPEAAAPPVAEIALTSPIEPAPSPAPVAEQLAPAAPASPIEPVAPAEPVSPPVVAMQSAPDTALSLLAAAAPMSLSFGLNAPQRRVATPVAPARPAMARR